MENGRCTSSRGPDVPGWAHTSRGTYRKFLAPTNARHLSRLALPIAPCSQLWLLLLPSRSRFSHSTRASRNHISDIGSGSTRRSASRSAFAFACVSDPGFQGHRLSPTFTLAAGPEKSQHQQQFLRCLILVFLETSVFGDFKFVIIGFSGCVAGAESQVEPV